MKKFGFFVKFDSIDSIIRSIRSIIGSAGVVDRPGKEEHLELLCENFYEDSFITISIFYAFTAQQESNAT